MVERREVQCLLGHGYGLLWLCLYAFMREGTASRGGDVLLLCLLTMRTGAVVSECVGVGRAFSRLSDAVT